MPPAQLDCVLRHLRRTASLSVTRQLTDAELLQQYVACRDEEAFATLVQRYGGLVRAVCRHVLHHEQDIDDAFQVTFLVFATRAASIRKTTAVASWLYGVAYRTAMNAKRSIRRRAEHSPAPQGRSQEQPVAEAALRELQAILDDEVNRLPEKHRAPFILCCLNGKSRTEAATELGWKEGTVSSRLAHARKELQKRLARRGVALAAALCATELGRASAAPVAFALVDTTVKTALSLAAGKAAVADLLSAEAALLLKGVLQGMVTTKLKIASLLLAVGLATGAALFIPRVVAGKPADGQAAAHEDADPGGKTFAVAKGGGQPETRHPITDDSPEVAVTGRVLCPDGKPFAGAKLYLCFHGSRESGPKVRAVSGADGQFRFVFAKLEITEPTWRPEAWRVATVVALAPGFGPDWTPAGRVEKGELTLRLVKDEYRIAGRVLDTEGRPLAGVTVRREEILTTASEDLTPVLKAWPQGAHHAVGHVADKKLANLEQAGLNQTATTGADGRFRLEGGGHERMTKLRIEGPAIQSMTVYVVPRDPTAIKTLNLARSNPAMRALESAPMLYGPRFDHVANPTKPILGTVRERGTGKPLAGVKVWGSAEGGWWENWAETRTDSGGRYRLVGLPKADRRQVYANAREGEPYHHAVKVVQDTQGLDPVTVDFELVRGVVVEGRMTDKKTGKPLQGIVSYVPLPDEGRPRETSEADAYKFGGHGSYADRDGKYRIVVLPGAGVLLAQSGNQQDNRYRVAHIDPADRKKPFLTRNEIEGEYFAGLNGARAHVREANAYRTIHPPSGAASFTCNFELDPGLTKTGSVVGPDGQPLPGVTAIGLNAVSFGPRFLETASFTVWGLDPDRPRSVVFYHPRRKLSAHVMVRGDDKEPLQVRLQPLGTLRGRLVDPGGKPIEAAQVYLVFLDPDGTRLWSLPAEPGKTDAGGRFQIGGIYPRMGFYLTIVKGNNLLLDGRRGPRLSLDASEAKNLGDVKATGADDSN